MCSKLKSSSSIQTCYSSYVVYLFMNDFIIAEFNRSEYQSHLTSLGPLITRSSFGLLDYIFFIIQNYLLFSFFTNSFLGSGSQCASTRLSIGLLTSFSNTNFVLINPLSQLCKNKLSIIFPYQHPAQNFSMAYHDCDTLNKWPQSFILPIFIPICTVNLQLLHQDMESVFPPLEYKLPLRLHLANRMCKRNCASSKLRLQNAWLPFTLSLGSQ